MKYQKSWNPKMLIVARNQSFFKKNSDILCNFLNLPELSVDRLLARLGVAEIRQQTES
jgi:hypothetical protein